MSYPLQRTGDQDFFVTAHGIIYTYDFQDFTAEIVEHGSPVLSGYDFTFHYFGFNSSLRPRPDPEVADTLKHISYEFFLDDSRVTLYVGDSRDKRSAASKGYSAAG